MNTVAWGDAFGVFDNYNPNVPASTTDDGVEGDYSEDNSFFYICIQDDTWRRVAVTSWGGAEDKMVLEQDTTFVLMETGDIVLLE
jgi:hypothetical protein